MPDSFVTLKLNIQLKIHWKLLNANSDSV